MIKQLNMFFKRAKFSIETLMEQIKPVETVKKDFACGEKAISDFLFGKFGLSRFGCKNRINNLHLFYDYRYNEILTQGTKPNFFQGTTLVQVKAFYSKRG